MMRIESVLFPSSDFGLLVQVFQTSAAINSPRTLRNTTVIRHLDSDIEQAVASSTIGHNFVSNVRKTRHHRMIVDKAKDGEVLCMMDCDTLVLGDLSELQMRDNDLVLTIDPTFGAPNTGVYFVRASEKVREWMRHWEAKAIQLLTAPQQMWKLFRQYQGLNQGALGWLREEMRNMRAPFLRIAEVPGEIWNCTPESIDRFSKSTKVLHINGWLRSACLGREIPEACKSIAPRFVDLWRQYA